MKREFTPTRLDIHRLNPTRDLQNAEIPCFDRLGRNDISPDCPHQLLVQISLSQIDADEHNGVKVDEILVLGCKTDQ